MAFIGIDLGTTTSEAAVFEEGDGPRILKDDRGNEIVDSYFGIDPKTNKPAVGEKVKNIFQSSPELAVEQIKRQMGDDTEIPFGSKEIESQRLSPEEISAHILRHLKRSAESQLDEEVDRCVITVPANFPDPARRATQQAGEIAGMNVERIINEPTAAALAYGHEEGIEDENVMVYDLGGGTFDVSIVKHMDDVLDVEASSGDTELGGKDFDEVLLWHVADKFEEEHGISIEPDSGNYYRLLFECEAAKKELSFNRRTSIHIPFFTVKDGNPVDLDVEITRSTFEGLISDKIDATEASIDKALGDAGLSPSDIDQVILIGGSTRIPYVQQHVEEVMGQSPKKRIDPDKTVALGAAVQSAIIDGITDTVIMDVCPLSLGTVAVEMQQGGVRPGKYIEIIETNSKVLRPHKDTFETIHEDQRAVDFRVYQRATESDSERAEIEGEPNVEGGFTKLLEKKIDLPQIGKRQKMEVKYVYNPDGMLNITVSLPESGKKLELQTQAGMDEEQIEKSQEKIEKAWKGTKYEALLQAAEDELQSGMEPEKEERLRSLMTDLKRAVAANNEDRADALEEEITDVLFELS
ncbi:MAG: Hsp70 family protein [Salinibacter sp.]|uniref:Hsp70 family protein n=1 Tax=Salinibacter sp. TaxID=2065818 RepID=UPI0035D46107